MTAPDRRALHDAVRALDKALAALPVEVNQTLRTGLVIKDPNQFRAGIRDRVLDSDPAMRERGWRDYDAADNA